LTTATFSVSCLGMILPTPEEVHHGQCGESCCERCYKWLCRWDPLRGYSLQFGSPDYNPFWSVHHIQASAFSSFRFLFSSLTENVMVLSNIRFFLLFRICFYYTQKSQEIQVFLYDFAVLQGWQGSFLYRITKSHPYHGKCSGKRKKFLFRSCQSCAAVRFTNESQLVHSRTVGFTSCVPTQIQSKLQ